MTSPQIWKTHKHRAEFNECPHCGGALRWVYTGEVWIPCDKEPTLFILHPDGNAHIVYKKQEYEKCLVYRKGDRRFGGEVLQGNTPHYYTCPVLRERRRVYIMERKGVRNEY